jgi:YYY domain-containing protein
MSEAFRWWLILVVVGVTLLPLCLALFRRLPDRGYALSKPFGLLFLGYTFWLLNSLHILPNSGGGIFAALVLLGAISSAFAYRERVELAKWMRAHWQYIVGVEVLFLLVFAVAVWLRSMVGNISGTEQPMDLMFVNAAYRAEHFPPKDPWLSGHTVAYYYFGYLLVAMMSRLSNVQTDIGYNIGLASIASMAFVGGAGIIYNLVQIREWAMPSIAARQPQRERTPKRSRRAVPADAAATVVPLQATGTNGDPPTRSAFNWRPPVFAVVGGLMLVAMGNLVWVFEFLSAYGIGGNGLYDWVNVQGLHADAPSHLWYPSGFFHFFNASRVFPLNNLPPPADGWVITELPMFSFLLGDLHPHVMALPFVLLVVAAALSLYRSREPLDITFWLQRPLALVGAALLFGGIGFINTWDVVTLGAVLVVMTFLSNYGRVRAFTSDLFVQVASFVAPLLLLAFILYIPFFVSIYGNSQANGLSAVVSNTDVTVPGTGPFHLLLFWGPLFTVSLPFVTARLLAARHRVTLRLMGWTIAPAVAMVIGWTLLFLLQKAGGPGPFSDSNLGTQAGGLFSQISDRGSAWISALGLGVILAGALTALYLDVTSDPDDEREAVIFALGLISLALLMILGCEFFFVGDVFHSRMNTVFKLYYGAWMLLAVASGFALYYLASSWRFSFPYEGRYRLAWGGLVGVVLFGASLYPIGGSFNRTYQSSGDLAGLQHNGTFGADDLAAIAFLDRQAQGQDLVIAEAVGNDYSSTARISEATGIPAILGWIGHENQWRGGSSKDYAGRPEDVKALYTTQDTKAMDQILKKYKVTYVYVGPLERSTYGDAGLEKFKSMPAAFQSGTVTIYRVSITTSEVSGE